MNTAWLPHANEHQPLHPSPRVLWRFTGTVYIPIRSAFDAMVLMFDDWLFSVIQDRANLLIIDSDTGVPFGGE